jgi:hypothetical protein
MSLEDRDDVPLAQSAPSTSAVVETPGRGVEGGTRTDDATADHEHVELGLSIAARRRGATRERVGDVHAGVAE